MPVRPCTVAVVEVEGVVPADMAVAADPVATAAVVGMATVAVVAVAPLAAAGRIFSACSRCEAARQLF